MLDSRGGDDQKPEPNNKPNELQSNQSGGFDDFDDDIPF